jgi:drug/metabolite transporter (DMT)-like permease
LPRLDWKAQVVLLALIWGLNFLEIRVAVLAISPVLVTLGRLVLGSAAVVGVLIAGGQRLPRSLRVWAHIAVAAALCNSIPYTLFAWGETQVSSVLAGILNAITPLMTVAAAAAFLPEERPRPSRLAGFAIGLVGVVLIVDPFNGAARPPLGGVLALLVATMCYGLGYVYVRRYLAKGVDSPVALAGAQLLSAAVQVALVAPFFARIPAQVPVSALVALAALGIAGTGIGYILQYAIVKATSATTSSLVLYLTPIVSTAAGVLLLGERLAWSQPAGAAVILLGVALAQGRVPAALRRTRAVASGLPLDAGGIVAVGDDA